MSASSCSPSEYVMVLRKDFARRVGEESVPDPGVEALANFPHRVAVSALADASASIQGSCRETSAPSDANRGATMPVLDPRDSCLLACGLPPTATRAQLSSLAFLPASLAAAGRVSGRGKGSSNRRGKKKSSSVPDGKIVSKVYNVLASRPFPPIGTLEQGITMTLGVNGAFGATSTAVPTYGAYLFVMNTVPSASALLAVFDQYRVEQLEVWIDCNNQSSGLAASNAAVCVDLDDANTPANFGDVTDRGGAVTGLTSDGFYLKWKPHIAVAAYSGAFTSFANEVAPWIDSASSGVQHYGLKYATSGTDAVARPLSITVRATVSFRAPSI